MKMHPVSHKPTETTKSFRIMATRSPHLWWSGCNWRSVDTGRSSKVKWVTIRFLHTSRDRMEKRRANGAKQHGSLRGFVGCAYWPTRVMIWYWPDLDLTWPEVKFWTWPFKVKKYMFRIGTTRWTRWCHFYTRTSNVKKLLMKTISVKNDNFHLMISGAETIDPRPNRIKSYLQCFFFLEFFLSIILLDIIMIVCEKLDLTWKRPL